MKSILISNEAYQEFKVFLDENKVESYNIRINYGGTACSGPRFNITIDEKKEDDIVEQVQDITFMIDKNLVDEFGGFMILSSEENEGRGMTLRAVLQPEGDCGTCGGCH